MGGGGNSATEKCACTTWARHPGDYAGQSRATEFRPQVRDCFPELVRAWTNAIRDRESRERHREHLALTERLYAQQ